MLSQPSPTANGSSDLNNPWVIIFNTLQSQESQQYRSQAIAEIAARSKVAGADLTPPDFVTIAPYPVLPPDVLAQVAETPGIYPNGKVNSRNPAIATLMRDGTGAAVGINLRFLKAYLSEDDIKTMRLGGVGKRWQTRAGFLPGMNQDQTCLGCEGADFQSFYLNRVFGLPTYQGLGSAGAISYDIESIKADKAANGWTKFILCLDRPFSEGSDTEINRSVAASMARNIIALREIGYDVKLMAFYDQQEQWIACDDGCSRYVEVEPEDFDWIVEAIKEQKTKEAKAIERQTVAVPDLNPSNPAQARRNQDLINAIADLIDVADFDRREDRILIASFYKSINDRPGFDKAWANKLPTERKYVSEMQWDWKRAEVCTSDELMRKTLAIAKRLRFDLSSWSKHWWADHPEFRQSHRGSRRDESSPSSGSRTPRPRRRSTRMSTPTQGTQAESASPTTSSTPSKSPQPMFQSLLHPPLTDPLSLFDLASELVQNIIQGKELYQDNAETSFYQVARELRGWENWTQKYHLHLDEDPQDLIDQAAAVLGLASEQIEAILDRINKRGDQHIPGVIYKADGLEVPAWVQVHSLDKNAFEEACPDELKPAVLDAIEQYRERYQKEVHLESPSSKTKRVLPDPTHNTRPITRIVSISQAESSESNSQQNTERPPDPYSAPSPTHKATSRENSSHPDAEIRVEIPAPVSNEQVKLDKTLARLGRNIAALKPPDPHGDRTVNGKNKYTIVLNVQTNTLKIYSTDRGEDPILLDADGKIDHKNSKVKQADVDAFRLALKEATQKKTRAAKLTGIIGRD